MKPEINLLIERLSAKLELRGIYFYDYPINEELTPHLMVVVHSVKGVTPLMLAPIVKLCMTDMPEIPFQVLLDGDWLNQLRTGSMYHCYASLPQHRLYYSGTKEMDSLLNKKVVSSLMEVNCSEYEKAKQLATEYLNAGVDFANRERFDQAIYMFHQYLEVRMRAFYPLIGRNLGKNHNLENIIKNVRGIVPELVSVFTYGVLDIERYRLLDVVFRTCVKGDSMVVSVEQYDFISTQCVSLAELLDAMMNHMAAVVRAYRASLPVGIVKEENKPTVKAVEQNKKLNKSHQVICEDFSGFPWPQRFRDDVNQLLDAMYSKYRPEQIMLVNYRTGEFSKGNPFQGDTNNSKGKPQLEMYVVVLMKNRGPFQFREMYQGCLKATLIFMDVRYVERAMKGGSRFENAVWKNGLLLRKKETFNTPLVPVDIDWKSKIDKIATLFCNSDATIKNLYGLIHEAQLLPLDSALLILHQIIDIGIRTYLKCAVGYSPEINDLAAIIDFCSIADTRILDYFYTWSQREKELLNLALKPQEIYWTNIAGNMNSDSTQVIIKKAKELVDFFGTLYQEVVRSMEERIVVSISEPETN